MKRFVKLFVLGFFLLFVAPYANADTLWGVTSGTGDGDSWDGGEIFTFDTDTNTTTIKHTYGTNELLGFGDIAVRGNGEVYVTYWDGGQDGFDQLAKVSTTTWGFDWVSDLGSWNDQVNALEFRGDTLYGVTGGGGIPANVLEFTLSGTGATYNNLGTIGSDSDGDIAPRGVGGNFYYTSSETGDFSDLSVINESFVSKTGKQIDTLSGWAGIAFSDDLETLYAGSYQEQSLWTLDWDTASTTHTASLYADLSSTLGGTINGLSNPTAAVVPEPTTMLLLGVGMIGLAGLGRKKFFKKD